MADINKIKSRIRHALSHHCHAARVYFLVDGTLVRFPPEVQTKKSLEVLLPVKGIYKAKHYISEIPFRVDRLRRIYVGG